MTIEIKVPALGESVTEATVGKWYKKLGDAVKHDELLVELETDKISMEVTAPSDGTVTAIDIKEGSVVHVGDILGSVKEGKISTVNTPNPDAIEKADPMMAQQKTKNIHTDTALANAEIIASPAAKKIMMEKNIAPEEVAHTGKDGRITKEDVLNIGLAQPTAPAPRSSKSIDAGRVIERVKMSKLRQTIAARLKMSQNTAAILSTFNEVDMSKVANLRNKLKDEFLKKHGVKLGFMSFFVKAVAAALKEFPAVNAEIEGEDIVYKRYFDIGVAVGTEKGLVVPILRNADKLSFIEIEKAIGDLAKKAREGKLTMEDLSGGTFSITNGGTYGSLLSTPIINPPQSGILGMHNIVERPVAVNGKVEIRPMMYIALSYDHRIIDGKDAVSFLVKVKEYVENPELFVFM